MGRPREVLILCAALCLFGPAGGLLVDTDFKAMMYLARYGYLSPQATSLNSEALVSADTITNAISDFQAFVGLNITGELDADTRRTMSLPRCGVMDVIGPANGARTKRYALQGTRWRVKQLTYKISRYTPQLPVGTVDQEVERAFSVWASVTPLKFVRRAKGPVHIEIRFEKGEHGDVDPFDGPGGTLAHASYPMGGGSVHFDEAERWTVGSYRGTNLFQVAVHEFGHALGLSHSDVSKSQMAPTYTGYEPSFRLDVDDILGIQALYGKKNVSASPESGPSSDGEQDPLLCRDASVDTVFNSIAGATYVFKGKHYWKLAERGIEPGYPRLIAMSWAGLSADIDAAFTHKNGKTYFFRGSQYWRFEGKKMDDDYPRLIAAEFPGIPDDIDAAFMWGGNGKFYFFKGSLFWRFDPSQTPPVRRTYPKLISNWEGVPDDLDAALLHSNGYTYFFKRGQYYRFNDFSFSVEEADPPFPRSMATWWFGCRDTEARSRSAGVARERDDARSGISYVSDLALDAGSAQSAPRDEVSGNMTDLGSRPGVDATLMYIATVIYAARYS